jgi:8-oxo-dGTP pyrophosphatase MutT (NUDIX family)
VPTIAGVRDLVKTFQPGPDDKAVRSRALVLALLAHAPAPFSRDHYDPGHLTASGIVLSPDLRGVLLVHHRRLDRWLQPGGHVEPDDATMIAAARREVLEETGVSVDERLPPAVVGIDVHDIPPARGEPHHLHHDLAFRFVAASTDLRPAAEVNQVLWCPVHELERYAVDEALSRSVERALRAQNA